MDDDLAKQAMALPALVRKYQASQAATERLAQEIRSICVVLEEATGQVVDPLKLGKSRPCGWDAFVEQLLEREHSILTALKAAGDTGMTIEAIAAMVHDDTSSASRRNTGTLVGLIRRKAKRAALDPDEVLLRDQRVKPVVYRAGLSLAAKAL